jgi:hypothetical protein
MLALNRVHVPLGLALIIGGITLDFAGGRTPALVAADLRQALASPDIWLLLLTIVFIVEMGRFMTEKENARTILAAISQIGGRHGRILALMASPAIVGLVPMPGGALFSAPLVRQVVNPDNHPDVNRELSDWMTAVNYWFRHIWEYWWPLYPGVIVAFLTFRMELWRFISVQIFFTPVAVLAGYIFLVRPHVKKSMLAPVEATPPRKRSLVIALPLLIVVTFTLLGPPLLKALIPGLGSESRRTLPTMLALLLGLLAGAVVIILEENRHGRTRFFKDALSRRSLGILFTVFGVMVFKALLETSGLVAQASADMERWHVPSVCAIAALPFLAGMVTGVAVGFTGASFPLAVALMESSGGSLTPLATLVLAFGFGYMGMMFSPVHICLLVTNEYFEGSLIRTFRRILPCGLVIMLFSIFAHIILQMLHL